MKKLVSFFEIPAADFSRAVKFYEAVLNLKLNVLDCGTEKMAFFPEEEEVTPGAISWAADFLPSKNGVLVSLNVEDMEETLSCIKENGGSIVREKTKIESDCRGYFAMFSDSEGNTLGLYSDK
ncbi:MULTISPECIES: VOC family protein [Parabacteroides]|jgi:predicted enzyme related to lactoylglutathione lyase|uniref:VOC family protein n=1 Tax=Parabacteroides TaxID=375288 RepID=UPI000EFDCC4D|nr:MULTISPECIES: VOC family protein [Parabacteroides]RHU21895.1 VOC family protein [Parabacteroides sp. TM07-1AC]WFE85316.1 VOC family protein [Parabacteroides chongii]